MLSQQLSTTNSGKVEIPAAQVTELYKIAKQNEYLKVRTTSAEKALHEAEKTVKAQDVLLTKKDAALKLAAEILEGAKKEHQKEIEIKDIQIEGLNLQLSESVKTAKKDGRKKWWNGFTYGGVSVGLVGTAAIFYLIAK